MFRIVSLFPLLTGGQGDEGNALVLAHRARRRGLEVEITTHHHGHRLPPGQIYLLGGTELESMAELSAVLCASNLRAAVSDEGAAVLAVDAGFQVLGTQFVTPSGREQAGVGLFEITSHRASPASGPVITRPNPDLGLPAMSGFEAHGGRSTLHGDAVPLARLELGVGNGDPNPVDGAVAGRMIGTYLHGPVLARNPELADLLLAWAVGKPLEPIPSDGMARLRDQRVAEDRLDPTGWGGRHYGSPRLREWMVKRLPGSRRRTEGSST